MFAKYLSQGDRLYKIVGNDMVEIDLGSWQYGVIGIAYGDVRTSPLGPNQYAKTVSEKKFNKWFKVAMHKINLLKPMDNG